MTLNLRQLLYFATAAEKGNITAAAQSLHIAQPALATQIKELEKQFETALLERHSRGVRLTPAGKLLFERAKKLLADAEETKAALAKFRDSGAMQVALGVSPSIVRFLGNNFVLDGVFNTPGMTVNLLEDRSPGLLRAVEEGIVDVALAYNVPERSTISRHAIIEEDFLFVSASNEFAKSSTISFSRAVKRKLILTGESGIIRNQIEQEAKRMALKVDIAYEVHSIEATKALLARDKLATILPWILAGTELKNGELFGTLIDRPRFGRVLYVVERAGQSRMSSDGYIKPLIDNIAGALLNGIGPFARALD